MTNPVPPPVPRKKHGCFFYGCITSLVLLLIIGIGGVLAVHYGIKYLVAGYTQATPAVLPAVKLPPEEMKQLQNRIAMFNSALKAHTNTPPLVLSSQEINALIADNPDLQNKFFVTLDGDKIKGQISLPLDDLGDVPMFKSLKLKGRYFNGGGTFKGAIHNGQLSVFVDSLDANGNPVPESFMTGLRQQNLADGFNKGTNAAIFEQYESLEVKDSSLIVRAKMP